MACFRTTTKSGFLHLDKVPDLRSFDHHGMMAKMRHWPHGAIIAHLGIDDQAVVAYLHTIANSRVGKPGAGPNNTITANDGFALDRYIRIDHSVAADLGLHRNIRIARIDERHAAFLHQFFDCFVMDHPLDRGKLFAVVDAFDLDRAIVQEYRNGFAGLSQNSRYIGQIILPLSVLVLNLLKGIEELSAIKTVYSGVDLGN